HPPARCLFPSMLSVPEALEKILSLHVPVATERISLLEADGRILAESLTASWPLPRFDNSAMDGFALRAADIASASAEAPVTLPIAGESAAGHPFGDPVPSGAAIRISTGARIPS